MRNWILLMGLVVGVLLILFLTVILFSAIFNEVGFVLTSVLILVVVPYITFLSSDFQDIRGFSKWLKAHKETIKKHFKGGFDAS